MRCTMGIRYRSSTEDEISTLAQDVIDAAEDTILDEGDELSYNLLLNVSGLLRAISG